MLSAFHVAHVLSLFILFGICMAAATAPISGNRKKFLMWSGIASLVAVLSGFGMAGFMKIGFPAWIWIKILCWFGLSLLVGLFFRKPEESKNLLIIAILIVLVALLALYNWRF
jgi:hypothetical protein